VRHDRRIPHGRPLVTIAYAILAIVVLQRIGELWYASSNTRALKARGATEHGRGHYPLIVLLHASWLIAIAIGIRLDAAVRVLPLVLFVLLQALRVWVLATMRQYWTTRIITLPDAPLVNSGPYQFVRHPNYLVVAGEIALLPLVFGQVANAMVFSVLNAMLLAWRVRVEEAALRPRRNPPSS
jgi:methyltransferase